MAIRSLELIAKSKVQWAKSEELIAKSKEKNAISEWHRVKSMRLYALCSTLLALCSLLVFSGGCASLQHKGVVLAVVNGESITEGDLKYSLTIAHRREDLSSAGALNLSQFVQKLID
ncbi:MAG: hypothetical protein A2Y81_13035 [Nitrospirae bacterium RBG_13_43_8]|nr:MAG: hypothetical protein A2Y81_13035 [Nitrospirae bacterium RBG_13_43_8]